ncbi:response regulator transcription factor [Candidatus Galacturonibacter soehngenii]|nr:response regulator [Candidatus Galacturonibacter soehngenii]MBA4687873.1 response regulator [Candidatus Galacturonibacter soehngenii]
MYRMLVADDEPIERMVICKTIKNNFKNLFEIVQAVNGREAIELFEQTHFDIVFLDIEMPGITGLEAAEKIRKKDKGCNIIFLTAYDEFGYAKKAITVKALNYLLKPGSEKEIVSTVKEALKVIEERQERQTREALATSELSIGSSENPEQVRINVVREEILRYIRMHYIEEISMQDVAEAMNYSNAYFCKLFKQGFQKSFTTYLMEYRIEKAKQLLSDVTINVKDISDKVGYKDSNYFAKVFKKLVGVTPSEYRIIILGKNTIAANNDEKWNNNVG